MEKLEFEVKFYLSSIQAVHPKITKLGARSRGRFFERNLRFEDKNKTLKGQKYLLRLRRDQKTTLTFKSRPPEDSDQFKVLRELEVEVSDFAVMNDILKALGFHCEQIYEKWRETLIIADTQFCLDAMPYGNFIEIEGPKEDIKQYAQRLGLQWDRRILINYLEVFNIIRKKLNLKFTDLTFDNFKDVEVNIAKYLDLMEVGSLNE